jgi:DNA-binding IscR family transcriptional regulator
VKLTRAAAYALHALVLLARHEGTGLVRAELARRARVPASTLRGWPGRSRCRSSGSRRG